VLGYTNQFLLESLEEEWDFRPLWVPIFMIWESECVLHVRRTRSPVEWHERATEIQNTMTRMRAEDAERYGEDEASRVWDSRRAEGLTDFPSWVLKGKPAAERLAGRVEYAGIRSLLMLWEARKLQGSSPEPTIAAAMLLFDAVLEAHEGDGLLERERRDALGALRAIEQERQRCDERVREYKRGLVERGILEAQEDPVLQERIAELEAGMNAAIEAARAEGAAAVEADRRVRSAKGGAKQAEHYAQQREKLIALFKEQREKFKSIPAAADALAAQCGFTSRVAADHLRKLVRDQPELSLLNKR